MELADTDALSVTTSNGVSDGAEEKSCNGLGEGDLKEFST